MQKGIIKKGVESSPELKRMQSLTRKWNLKKTLLAEYSDKDLFKIQIDYTYYKIASENIDKKILENIDKIQIGQKYDLMRDIKNANHLSAKQREELSEEINQIIDSKLFEQTRDYFFNSYLKVYYKDKELKEILNKSKDEILKLSKEGGIEKKLVDAISDSKEQYAVILEKNIEENKKLLTEKEFIGKPPYKLSHELFPTSFGRPGGVPLNKSYIEHYNNKVSELANNTEVDIEMLPEDVRNGMKDEDGVISYNDPINRTIIRLENNIKRKAIHEEYDKRLTEMIKENQNDMIGMKKLIIDQIIGLEYEIDKCKELKYRTLINRYINMNYKQLKDRAKLTGVNNEQINICEESPNPRYMLLCKIIKQKLLNKTLRDQKYQLFHDLVISWKEEVGDERGWIDKLNHLRNKVSISYPHYKYHGAPLIEEIDKIIKEEMQGKRNQTPISSISDIERMIAEVMTEEWYDKQKVNRFDIAEEKIESNTNFPSNYADNLIFKAGDLVKWLEGSTHSTGTIVKEILEKPGEEETSYSVRKDDDNTIEELKKSQLSKYFRIQKLKKLGDMRCGWCKMKTVGMVIPKVDEKALARKLPFREQGVFSKKLKFGQSFGHDMDQLTALYYCKNKNCARMLSTCLTGRRSKAPSRFAGQRSIRNAVSGVKQKGQTVDLDFKNPEGGDWWFTNPKKK